MKKIILILMLFKSCGMAYGQTDTIPCIMLATDTSTFSVKYLHQPKVYDLDKMDYERDTVYYKRNETGMIRGYEVREKKQNGGLYELNIQGEPVPVTSFNHIAYLNENKQLIDKKTIVWLTK